MKNDDYLIFVVIANENKLGLHTYILSSDSVATIASKVIRKILGRHFLYGQVFVLRKLH